jgi:predicted nucleotidyltransferase
MGEKIAVRELREIHKLLSLLIDKGVDYMVTGGAALSILLNEKTVEEDLDIIAFSPDPVLEEDFYYDLSVELGCEYEKNSLGGPKLIFEDGFSIDFFSVSMNLEVPQDILQHYEKVRLPDGKIVKVASLEAALLLKAQAVAWETASEEELESYVARIGKRINKSKIDKLLELYDEGVRKTLVRVIRKAGFS